MPDLIPSAFAIEGDKTIPPATDPNGFVNFLQGYTDFYELNLESGNPDAKAVERGVQNYLFGLTTDNIAWLQRNGLPMWYPNMPNGYPKNAIVQRVATDGTIKPYRSLVASNMSDPLTTPASWEYEPTAAETLLNVPMPSGGSTGASGLLISVATDLNSVGNGTYEILNDTVAASCSHIPTKIGGAITAGLLEVASWNNGAAIVTVQRYTDRAGAIYSRASVGASWTNWAQAIDKSTADLIYAAINGSALQLFSVADATGPKHAINQETGDARYASITTGFVAGTRIIFQQTVAPTGWTKITTYDDAALRVVSGAAGSGGSTSFSSVFTSRTTAGSVGNHTLVQSEMPVHYHVETMANGDTAWSQAGGGSTGSINNGGAGNGVNQLLTGPGGADQPHNHPFNPGAMDFAVKYVDTIIAQKN